MKSFKDIAYKVLKEAKKPLHSREITKRALKKGMVSEGKTPEMTMNALLIVDVNKKKERSLFIKTAPSTFSINQKVKIDKPEAQYSVSKDISSQQKGSIAEARIAELIVLYGETSLSCYKPISDDDGIDLIVKQKGSLKTMYIQVKSRFGNGEPKLFQATAKRSTVVDNYSMAMVFCYFDIATGDIWNYVWFVPAPNFIKKASHLKAGMLSFVAGSQKKESNKWDEYLINKKDLANKIVEQMKRI